MRRYFLLIMVLIFTVSCSRADSAYVEQWLESLDPNTQVIEVKCTADVAKSAWGEDWEPFKFDHAFDAWEVLDVAANRGLDWAGMIDRMVKITEVGFSRWVSFELKLPPTTIFRVRNVKCDGKALRAPSIPPRCPNATDGCDEPPDPLDQPLLPLPPPDPGGGGDF
jgi:hypothetical protein